MQSALLRVFGQATAASEGHVARFAERLALWLAILAALLYAAGCLSRPPVIDEFAYLHTGWRVASGERPYLDFFEHHNPLYWYLVAGLFRAGLSECHVFWSMRALNVVLALWLAVGASLLTARAGGGRLARLVAVCGVLAVPFFAFAYMEVRADMLMVSLALAGVLVAGAAAPRPATAAVAGLALGVGFCVIQKVVVFVAALWPVYWSWWRAREGRVAAAFSIGLMAPVATLVGSLWAAGWLRDWWVLNYQVNWEGSRRAAFELATLASQVSPGDYVFLAAACVGIGLQLSSLSGRRELVWPLATMAVALILGRVPPSPYYFMPLGPFLAALAGLAIEAGVRRMRALGPAALSGILGVLGLTLYLLLQQMLWQLRDPLYTWNLERASFVLANTTPRTAVFDPTYQFNISRPDAPWDNLGRHFFGPILRRLGYPAHEDSIALLSELKPRFVATHDLTERERAFVDAHYVRCGYPDLRILGAKAELTAGKEVELRLLAAGRYVLEAPGPVSVDGLLQRPGQVLDLAQGTHRLGSGGWTGAVELRLDTVPAPYRSRWDF